MKLVALQVGASQRLDRALEVVEHGAIALVAAARGRYSASGPARGDHSQTRGFLTEVEASQRVTGTSRACTVTSAVVL